MSLDTTLKSYDIPRHMDVVVISDFTLYYHLMRVEFAKYVPYTDATNSKFIRFSQLHHGLQMSNLFDPLDIGDQDRSIRNREEYKCLMVELETIIESAKKKKMEEKMTKVSND